MRTTRFIRVLAIPGVLAGGLAGTAALLAPTSAAAIPAQQKACANSAQFRSLRAALFARATEYTNQATPATQPKEQPR